jgi:hypothetical protein
MVLSLRNKLRSHACMQRSQGNGERKEFKKRRWGLPKGNDLFTESREQRRGAGNIARREKRGLRPGRSKLATKRGGLVLRNPMILFEGTGGRD